MGDRLWLWLFALVNGCFHGSIWFNDVQWIWCLYMFVIHLTDFHRWMPTKMRWRPVADPFKPPQPQRGFKTAFARRRSMTAPAGPHCAMRRWRETQYWLRRCWLRVPASRMTRPVALDQMPGSWVARGLGGWDEAVAHIFLRKNIQHWIFHFLTVHWEHFFGHTLVWVTIIFVLKSKGLVCCYRGLEPTGLLLFGFQLPCIAHQPALQVFVPCMIALTKLRKLIWTPALQFFPFAPLLSGGDHTEFQHPWDPLLTCHWVVVALSNIGQACHAWCDLQPYLVLDWREKH